MKLIESVPNFSCTEAVLESIVAVLKAEAGLTVLNHSADHDHNRSVVTVIGPPEALETTRIYSAAGEPPMAWPTLRTVTCCNSGS